MLTGSRGRSGGFTLIELMVTVALVGILMALAAPAASTWIKNTQVRAVADALQSGIKLAQAESVRRYRQVVFFRTTSKACNATAAASTAGQFWQIRTIAAIAGDPVAVVQCGVLSDVAGGIALSGPTALCFNADGRQIANAATGVTGATCSLSATGAANAFNVSHAQATRALRVMVTLGGSIRLCDPAKSISTSPDGCPA